MKAPIVKRGGFTLVELSIVLVIIGLLIGGILVGQSMMSTAKITSTIKQISQFDAGVESFKSEYKYLPGDAPAFGGDGDGLIDQPFTNQYIAQFTCESADFWSSFMPNQYTSSPSCPSYGAPGYSTGPSKNLPLSQLGAPGTVFYATAPANGWTNNADPTNIKTYYAIVSGSPLQTTEFSRYCLNTGSGQPVPAVKPADLLALDKKMDDGLATSGNVIAGYITGEAAIMDSLGDSGCNNTNSPNYLVQSNAYACTPLIRIGGSVNDPQ